MLKEQLKNIALKLVTVPEHFELHVEDYTQDHTIFMWKEKNGEEDFYVELDPNGKLTSLTNPALQTGPHVSLEEQQNIAEQFLMAQYEEALNFLTLSTVKESKEGTRFKFEQFVGDYPLASYYCLIVISPSGDVIDFTYRGYTTSPPPFPTTIAPKEAILQHFFDANWTVNMNYFSQELYSVPASGLYLIYKSSVVYRTYDAETAKQSIEIEPDEETETFGPFPQVNLLKRETAIEKIIGIPNTMEIIRQSDIEEDEQNIVWREKNWIAPDDKSIDGYFLSRFEECVKAKINVKTNQLNGLIWLKKRNGNLDLTFDSCRNVAASFIATYYSEYVPYLQMKIEEPSFNDLHRAMFIFPISIDGYRMDGEFFMVSVNKTTGYIDMLMTPDLDISAIDAYTASPIIDLAKVKQACKDVDALLRWETDYKSDIPSEHLKYAFRHRDTKQDIKGIDAVTGHLIVWKL